MVWVLRTKGAAWSLALLSLCVTNCAIEPNPSPYGTDPNGEGFSSVPAMDGEDAPGESTGGTQLDGGTLGIDALDGTGALDATDGQSTTDGDDTSDNTDGTDGSEGTDGTDALPDAEATDCYLGIDDEDPELPDGGFICANPACETPPKYSEHSYRLTSLHVPATLSVCGSNTNDFTESDTPPLNAAPPSIVAIINTGFAHWLIDQTLSLAFEFADSPNVNSYVYANVYSGQTTNNCDDIDFTDEAGASSAWNNMLCNFQISKEAYDDTCPAIAIPTALTADASLLTVTTDRVWNAPSFLDEGHSTAIYNFRAQGTQLDDKTAINGVLCGNLPKASIIWHLRNFIAAAGPESTDQSATIDNYEEQLTCGPDDRCPFAIEFVGSPVGALIAPETEP